MALGVGQAIAELLRDGDPARSIPGLQTLYGFELYDDTTPGPRIFVSEGQPLPDQSVTVIVEAGGPAIPGSNGVGVGRQPAFTVRSRDPSYERSLEVAHSAYAILDEYEGTKNGVPFFRVNANFEPLPLGRDRGDEGGNWLVSQTFRSVSKRYALT